MAKSMVEQPTGFVEQLELHVRSETNVMEDAHHTESSADMMT